MSFVLRRIGHQNLFGLGRARMSCIALCSVCSDSAIVIMALEHRGGNVIHPYTASSVPEAAGLG